jgi:hypothetical protein
VITALGQTWCEDHFTCEVCNKSLADGGVYKHENKPYCFPCFDAAQQPKTCAECKKPIVKLADLVQSMGDDFHTTCLVCCRGHAMEDKQPFWKFQNKLYCKTHWDAEDRGDRCFECKKPVTHEYVKLGNGKEFHHACWACKICKAPIKGEKYKEARDMYLCLACFAKLPASGEGVWINGVYIPPTAEWKEKEAKRLVRGYGEYTCPPGVIPPNESKRYPLEVLRLPYDKCPKVIDFRQREQYLEESVFKEVFGVDMQTFNDYPLWKRIWLKKEKGLF